MSFRDVSKDRLLTNIQRKVEAMLNVIRQFVKEEEGASAAEYALLLVVITLGIVGAVNLLGANITLAINQAAGLLVGS
jgi:pilus assembly protein Flp/PilA